MKGESNTLRLVGSPSNDPSATSREGRERIRRNEPRSDRDDEELLSLLVVRYWRDNIKIGTKILGLKRIAKRISIRKSGHLNNYKYHALVILAKMSN